MYLGSTSERAFECKTRRRDHRVKHVITATAARVGRKRLKTTCFGTRRGLSLLGTDFPSPTAGHDGYTIKAPGATTIGSGDPPDGERSRVFTIAITAPQHAHIIGARVLTQASARPGSN